MKLGLIGIGLMGTPLAKNLIEAGHSLNIYNRTLSKTFEIEKMGAVVYKTSAELIKKSDAIILMLTDYDAVCNVLLDENDSQYENKTIIQMSTIAPEESKEIELKVNKLRGEYFEAPVLGSINQILNKELITLIGATKVQYDKWNSLFKTFGNNVIHVGTVGDASAMKLALNQLIVSQTVAFSMSLGYLREKELDVNMFMNILRNSALYAPTFDKKLENMLERNFDDPNFPVKHLLKDLDLILGEFGQQNINTNSLKGIRKIFIDSIEMGNAEMDYSAIYDSIHKNQK